MIYHLWIHAQVHLSELWSQGLLQASNQTSTRPPLHGM
jgi:hypothetical protein